MTRGETWGQAATAPGDALTMKKKKPITIQVGYDYGGYKVLDIELRFCGEYSKRRLLYGKFACPTCQTLNWTTCRAIAQWVAHKTPWSCERCRTTARKKREVVNRKLRGQPRKTTCSLCGDPFTTRSTSNRCRQCVSDGIAREKEASKSPVNPRVKALLDKQPPDVRKRAIQIAAQHLKAMRAVHVPEAINLTAILQEAVEVARLGEEGTAQPVQYEYRNFAIDGGEK